MQPSGDEKRRAQYDELLGLLVASSDFAKQEIQSRCQEAKPRFITNVLKQLVSEGVLRTTGSTGSDTRFSWATPPQSFPTQHWIEQQFRGSQVTQSPPEERPRERLLELGPVNLKTSELLAILIRSGRKGESAVQAGQKLSNFFHEQMESLPRMSPAEFKQLSTAVSEVAFCQIQAGVELGRRVHEAALQNSPKGKINSTHAAIDYCSRHFARLAQDGRQEEFHIVTLDTKLQPIQSHRITVGTLDASLVHPREVFRAAIRDAASSILLVHNHPSGDPTPSRQDREVTERLKRSGELIGIQVIDHVIVARERTVSLAEEA
ncbi:RadC family protein [Aureliella helgolandensis]|uniref:MPN domain-containing protein n=1 Tax=Aureliella helgolandensis TaxID=2527968 RepID=A0A518GGJ6_9BACT|nr:DNA repair protein RadC [Aureliella helgolandensis]QDV27721.1 hypothetical protein Q31a_61140 [Aureliella helgolandensis]